MKYFYAALVSLLALFFSFAPAFADEAPYIDGVCGNWVDDNWVPNGKCPDVAAVKHDTVSSERPDKRWSCPHADDVRPVPASQRSS